MQLIVSLCNAGKIHRTKLPPSRNLQKPKTSKQLHCGGPKTIHQTTVRIFAKYDRFCINVSQGSVLKCSDAVKVWCDTLMITLTQIYR